MESLDRYLAQRAQKQEFSGVALVAQDDAILLNKGYGWADVANKIPNTTDTLFQIASVAKTLTATAVLVLVGRGKFDLDAQISNYIPDTPPAWQAITVEQLLAHTSGIPEYFSFVEFEGVLDLTSDGIITAAKKYPLLFKSGTAYAYSDTGYTLLGKIIEKVSGSTYGAFMRETIFDPLQMNVTGRDENNIPQAIGYVSYGQAATMFPVTNALGDGDFYSTVGDMYRFDRALYGDKIISSGLRERMFTPIANNEYGLGWQVDEWNGRRVLSHDGILNGFRSEFMRFPEADTVIILLSNLETFDAVEAAWELAKIVFA